MNVPTPSDHEVQAQTNKNTKKSTKLIVLNGSKKDSEKPQASKKPEYYYDFVGIAG